MLRQALPALLLQIANSTSAVIKVSVLTRRHVPETSSLIVLRATCVIRGAVLRVFAKLKTYVALASSAPLAPPIQTVSLRAAIWAFVQLCLFARAEVSAPSVTDQTSVNRTAAFQITA